VVRAACLFFTLLPLVGCSSPALVATAPPLAGEVRLWQDAAIFGLVDAALGSVRHRVLVEMYELGRAEIVRELGAARARGVAVRVITDPTVKASRDSAAALDALGVAERAYPVDDVRHQIDHVKLLIADTDAVVGGMNWGRHSERHHDYVLQTRVAADVERLARIFEQDWELAAGRPAPLAMSVVSVAQTAPGVEIRRLLERAFRSAHRRILAEVYTLTDPDVVAQLALAHRRGLDVRVILDPNQEYNLHPFAVLRAASVRVRWYPVPIGILLHAKIGLFDDELVLGSANWTVSGLGVNHELDIATGDQGAIGAYRSRFESDWARSRAG
jgi:phosphatidylserine/phosphatidylglycerophosphate/cardiolipin synthase-like enzyme